MILGHLYSIAENIGAPLFGSAPFFNKNSIKLMFFLSIAINKGVFIEFSNDVFIRFLLPSNSPFNAPI